MNRLKWQRPRVRPEIIQRLENLSKTLVGAVKIEAKELEKSVRKIKRMESA